MLNRVLEVEVMDTPEEAIDYNQMDHSDVNQAFVQDFLSFAEQQEFPLGSVLDAGTGTALIPIELCQCHECCQVTGVDMAANMLTLAEENVRRHGLSERISLRWADAKALPFQSGSFQCVMSNSIVHHIPKPFDCLQEFIRVLQPGGLLFVRDLMRPETDEQVRILVESYAGSENQHARQMFDDSLRAALSLDEMRNLVENLGFSPSDVRATSDRHWTWATQISSCPSS